MLYAVAKKSGHELDNTYKTKFISTVGSGALAYYGGCKAATYLFHLIPGAGTIAAMGVSSAVNALFTYKFGVAITKLFDKPDLDLSDAATMATTVISLMCTIPNLGEIKEIVDLANITS